MRDPGRHERSWLALDLEAIGPEIEHHELFPNRTNVSWFTTLDARQDPRADLRARRGGDLGERTGATGAAVAYVLDGGSAPVTVVLDGGELEVEVGEDLHITPDRLGGARVRRESSPRTSWRSCDATE